VTFIAKKVEGSNRLPENIESIYPLAPMQKGLLISCLSAPAEASLYFQQLTWTIRAELNAAMFREAWTRVVHRHPVLRTFFVWEGRDEPVQCVCTRVQVPWQDRDWREGIEPSRQRLTHQQLAAYLAADRARAFCFNEAPLVRFHLLRLERSAFQFVWSFHHILMDGWSLSMLVREAFAIYRHLTQATPLQLEDSPPYRDFVVWNLRQDHANARESWRQRLRGFRTPTALRLDAPPEGTKETDESANPEWIRLSEPATARLRNTAKRCRCTLSTLVQAAWAMLLRCYSGESDLVFGVTIAGRAANLPRVDRMIGLFINTLPVRICIGAADRLSTLLADLMRQQIQRDELSYCSLAEVQAVSEVSGGTPLFDSIIVFENYPIDTPLSGADDPLAINNFEFFERTGYPLTLLVMPHDELTLKLSYDVSRFNRASVVRLLRNVGMLLENIAINPDGRVGDYEIRSRDDLALIREINRTEAAWDLAKPVHARIEQQAELTPDAVALLVPATPATGQAVGESVREITYSELNRRANRVAHLLRRRGVQQDQPVGIYMERSADLVIGLLGIWKAGGAYVPLDPSYPADRIQYMLRDARPRVVLTQQHLLSSLDQTAADRVALDDPLAGHHAEPDFNLEVPTGAGQLAYIIYTSGSTGQPKGAMNTHGAVLNRLLWMQQEYRLCPGERILQKTPFSFDVSVWEFFWPLMTGAQLLVAQPTGHQDPDYLIRAIQTWSITTVHFVPSMLRQFLDAPGLERCASLQRVICSGEALPRDLEARFFEHLDARLYNLYGPTETAVDVTAWQCSAGSTRRGVPIGLPIANTEIYLLDENLRPVPLGVPGEIYIGGLNVGRGYWGRPDLTAEKYIPDPFSRRPGARLYRSGDLARQGVDGVIEYLDRLDYQVKIRGFRIELSEVESWLARAQGVQECAVLAWGDATRDRYLVAYVVPREPDAPPTTGSLRHFLREHVPEFMIPTAFVWLAHLPLNPNGKLDRRALPAPDARCRSASIENLALPRSETEHLIAAVWQEVLGLERVGIHDNFFDIGGNSLRLLPVQRRLQQLFGRPIGLPALFRHPTVALLAEELDTEPKSPEAGRSKLAAQDEPSSRPRRLYAASQQHLRLDHRRGALNPSDN
jgi:amino acid adenylation domain-containing protein